LKKIINKTYNLRNSSKFVFFIKMVKAMLLDHEESHQTRQYSSRSPLPKPEIAHLVGGYIYRQN
jgi:hypothetical protein